MIKNDKKWQKNGKIYMIFYDKVCIKYDFYNKTHIKYDLTEKKLCMIFYYILWYTMI